MRPLLTVVALLLVGTPPIPAQEPPPASGPELPIRRVVLYKAGIGYFEHLGTVRGAQAVSIRFTNAQLDDALKSLTAIDLGKGQVTGISYGSVAPVERRLSALRLPLGGNTTTLQVLNALRGADVEVTAGTTTMTGRLLSVEERMPPGGPGTAARQFFSVVSDAGEMRMFELTPDVRLRLADRGLRTELGRYLDVVGAGREQDLRRLTISTSGSGDRQLFVSYISEVPIWKSTYRLVIPPKGRPFLQGWAIVDNTVGEDWTNVELSLVAGAPQSFIQQLSQPFFGRRPVVPLSQNMLRQPQTHGATLQQGPGVITGRVTDANGRVIPGARIRMLDGAREMAMAVSDQDGNYRVVVAPGTYTLQAELAGFRTHTERGVIVNSGDSYVRPITLVVGALSETVTVMSQSQSVAGFAGGRYAPAAPPPPPAPAMPAVAADAYEQLRSTTVAAQGADAGELFEYRLKEPVTLKKNESALVPIVNAEVGVEKVSLWSRTSGSGRPLKAMWITNSSGLTLDAGSLSIVDGQVFAGEGLIESLKPGEKRLVSYATDLSLQVAASAEGGPRRVQTIRAREGILIQETEERATTTYTMRSEAATAATVVVEHPVRAGWTLVDGQLPAETTTGAYRFRTAVDPGKEATLVIRERRPETTRISVGDIDEALLVQLTASGVDGPRLQQAFAPILQKRAEIARADARLAQISAERERIEEDQERIRENMKSLRGSSEEKQLLQRYTRQLDQQENRLEELQRSLASATSDRDRLHADLARLIGTVSFELSVEK
jgi:hypothetical protein